MPDVQQEQPMIILKGDEVAQFESLLDTMPHGYAKKIIQFINAIQQRRIMEEQEQSKSLVLKNPEAGIKDNSCDKVSTKIAETGDKQPPIRSEEKKLVDDSKKEAQ